MAEPLLWALVLVAAAMHASWNALVKHASERWLTFAVVSATGALGFLPVALAHGPPAPAAVPFLAASGVIHLFYFSFLVFAYTHGDFSQTYPIARGLGPLIVGLVSLAVLHEPARPASVMGVVMVSLGVMVLASGGGPSARRGVGFAAATGVFIAAYTLADGLGVRASPSRLSYIAWLHLTIGLPFSAFVFWRRRGAVGPFLRAQGLRASLAGVLAALAYSLVLFAMSRVSLAVVAALREVSVVFAAVIGARLLREPLGRRRLLAAGVVVIGIACLAAGRA